MPQVILNEAGQTTLDGSGNGAVTIGPSNSYQTWKPTGISVQVITTTGTIVKEPVFKYYRGRSAGPLNFLGGTFTGSNDSSDIPAGQILHPGETFYCVWTGGDAGATASVILSGTMDVP